MEDDPRRVVPINGTAAAVVAKLQEELKGVTATREEIEASLAAQRKIWASAYRRALVSEMLGVWVSAALPRETLRARLLASAATGLGCAARLIGESYAPKVPEPEPDYLGRFSPTPSSLH